MATKSIGLTGRDYSTLAAWASYVNALSLTENEIGEVYNDGEVVETAAITLGGWTAGGFGVTLRPAAGQGFKDHASVATNALRYNASLGAAIRSTYNAVTATPYYFAFTGINLAIQDLQFLCDGPTNNPRSFNMGSATLLVQRCILASNNGGNFLQFTAAATMRNTLAYTKGLQTSASGTGFGIAGAVVENCTIANLTATTSTGLGTAYLYQPTIKNTVVYGWSTDASGTFNTNSTNNATSKTAWGGTNIGASGQVNVAAGDFVSLTSGSEDFRIAGGSTKLNGTGATLGTVTADILGTSRSAPYSIGAYQQPPAPSAPTVTTSPTNQSAVEGATATFTAAFGGFPTPTYQWQLSTNSGGSWANVTTGTGGTTTSYTTAATTISGGSANNGDQYRCVATNASGTATSAVATLTVSAAGDTTPPTLSGALTVSGITQTSLVVDGPTGSDNVAVTGYEFSTDGTTWGPAGWPAPSRNITGLTAGTTYTLRMRCYDAAGNRSNIISTSVTTLAAGGTLTSSALRNNTGTLLPSLAATAFVHTPSTGALVLLKTGLTSNGSGVISFSDAALSSGVAYRVIWKLTASGAEGMETLTAV